MFNSEIVMNEYRFCVLDLATNIFVLALVFTPLALVMISFKLLFSNVLPF